MTYTPSSSLDQAITHCGACASPGVVYDGKKVFSCQACGWEFYKNPAAAVVGLLQREDQWLFVRRARPPQQGMLDLPGGFVDPCETAEEALRRELQEELGLDISPGQMSFVGTHPNTEYRYKDIAYQSLDLFFHIQITGTPRVHDADEIAGIVWLRPEEIDPSGLAFDSIRHGIAAWMK